VENTQVVNGGYQVVKGGYRGVRAGIEVEAREQCCGELVR